MGGGPFFALTTPKELTTLDGFLVDWFTVLMSNRLQGVIGWDESRVFALVLLGGARLFVVISNTLLLLGLGTIVGKMARLIAIETNSGFLGGASGTRVVVLLLHEHVGSCLKKVGTDSISSEVGWRCFGVLNRCCWRPGDVLGLHLQLVSFLSQDQDVFPS